MRAIPSQAVEFVASQEGLRLKAYLDSAGIPTIGYGHIDGVQMGQTCTKAQATTWLAQDMQIAVSKLYGVLKSDIIDCLNDQQWAALLSFAFNVGAGADWTIWKLLNAKKFDQAADQLSRFINADGVKVQGLVNRRAAEFVLWHSGDVQTDDVSSAVTREVGMTPPTPAAKKPLWMSKTFWTGGGVTAAGLVNGAQTVQGIAAPQAYHSPWLGKLVGLTAILIVVGGALIVFFKMMEQRAETHQ